MPNPFTLPITLLGQTLGREPHRAFGIYQADRLYHSWIIGQTGTGKTTLLKNMALQDLEKGQGFTLIDPHGDLAEELRPYLPDTAIYWDLTDPES